MWAQYSHNTCGLLSYGLKKLQEKKAPGDSVTLEEGEHFLGRVLQGVDVIDSPNEAFHFDKSSGDCASVHLFLKRQLEQEAELGFMRWNIYEGGTHAILFGTSVDGSGFLIDFGGMREVVFTGGTGVFQFVPVIGKVNVESDDKLEFRVTKGAGISVKIESKV